MYVFRTININDIKWDSIESTYDSNIYKSKEWFCFLQQWKRVSPFIVAITLDGNDIGYFVGELLHKGIRIIGSPFEGIGTAYQGLNLLCSMSASQRLTIYEQLTTWIFVNNFAWFVQVEDWQLTMNDLTKFPCITYEGHDGYAIDLTLDEDVLFHNLHQKSCRYSINKAIKNGINIREPQNIDTFIDIYYNQLIEVFKKQGLRPTYGIDCVRSLITALYPNKILLLEAVSQDDKIIATGIFPGDNNMAVFWGGASYSAYQRYCPNELLIWEAIIRWKSRGAKLFDLCGVRPYKLKFGPIVYTKPRLIFAKYPLMIPLKNLCKKIYYGLRRI